MLNTVSRKSLLTIWFATLAIIIAGSVVLGASFSTSALLLVVGVVPPGVMLLIGVGAPPPTVAEVLYAVNNAKDGRS